MKKLYFLIAFFVAFLFAAQKYQDLGIEKIAENEARHFKGIMDYNVNPNTLNYDLKYQRLELIVNPAVNNITGTVTSHFLPNQNISSIYFDMTNFIPVTQVTYHGNTLNFTQLSSQELKIDFPAQLQSNVLDSLSISYSGAADQSQDGMYFEYHNDGPIAFTLTEPYGPRNWFPTKQSLNDKIERLDLKITTPSQYSVAGNGVLKSETVNGANKTAFWRTDYPTPAYLVAIGVTNYVIQNDTVGNPAFPYINYIIPSSNVSSELNNLLALKGVMNIFEQNFGAYPYRNEKYGHMEYTFTGSGMEHSTMSSVGGFNIALTSHELAHQWFGDKLTCKTWNDIWLNEGFATFGAHVAREKQLNTPSQFMTFLLNEKDDVTSQPGGSVYVPDSELGNVGRIFNGRLSYSKGAYVLRMLKWILTDPVFYSAITDYANRVNLAYNYVSTDDLKASLLTSTGTDFTGFFADWIYGEGYPIYTIRWNQTGNNFILKASQTRSSSTVSFFDLPLPIKVNGTNGEVAYLKLNNTSNNQVFVENVPFTVSSVQFNYEYQILERNSTVAKDTSLLGTSDFVLSEFKIYPNPVKDILNISGLSKSQNFEIRNTEGRLIKTGNTSGYLDVSTLAKGMYILSINGSSTKFIKE